MKKILILLLLLLIITGGLYAGASTFQTIEPIRPFIQQYVAFVDTLLGIEKAEIGTVTTEEIFNENEHLNDAKNEIVDSELETADTENENSNDSQQEALENDNDAENTDSPVSDKESLDEEQQADETLSEYDQTEYINLKFYEDEIMNFTYPSDYEILNTSDLSLEIQKNGQNLAYLDIFENPEQLSLTDFLKQDNISNYLLDVTSYKLETESLDIGQSTTYIKDYPGIQKQDIYLVVFNDKIILIKVFEEKEAIKKYLVSNLEER